MANERGAFGFFYQIDGNGDLIIGLFMSEEDMKGEWVFSGPLRGGLGSINDIRDQESFEQ